jgi:ABC-2 type transport system ATP-binding protein
MEKVLKVKNLSKTFRVGFWRKPKKVLHNISFELSSGIMTGFLGVNGAGKSTTIKCILDLISPEEGEILFFDNQPLNNSVKKRIAYLPEKPQLYDHLTGHEFLELTAAVSERAFSKNIEYYLDEVLELVDLKTAKEYKLREYSKGMYQRMGLAQAILRDPQLIILDEPMADLDPAGRSLVKDILRRIQREKKVSIFMSSHLLQDIESLCSEIVILNKGEMKYSGATLDFVNKLNPKFEIFFNDNTGKIQNILTESEDDLQIKIDSIRQQKSHILSVQNQKSLEEAFKNFIERF